MYGCNHSVKSSLTEENLSCGWCTKVIMLFLSMFCIVPCSSWVWHWPLGLVNLYARANVPTPQTSLSATAHSSASFSIAFYSSGYFCRFLFLQGRCPSVQYTCRAEHAGAPQEGEGLQSVLAFGMKETAQRKPEASSLLKQLYCDFFLFWVDPPLLSSGEKFT